MFNPRFDLVTLKVFIAVGELRSISGAARRESIAVSAVSKRVSDLEDTLGTRLLSRLPRGVELTASGTALLHHAKVILRDFERLEGDLSEYARGVKGHVRMVVNQSSIVQFLPEDLSGFVREFPDIKIDLREDNSAAILRAVADGLAEIGVLTAGPAVPSGLEIIPYRHDCLALILPPDHPLGARRTARLADALAFDVIGLDVDSAWDALLVKAAEGLGGPLRLRFRVASFDAVCRLIRAGLGIGIAPAAILANFTSGAGLQSVPLDEEWAARKLVISVRSLDALPASARLMVRHLTECGRVTPS